MVRLFIEVFEMVGLGKNGERVYFFDGAVVVFHRVKEGLFWSNEWVLRDVIRYGLNFINKKLDFSFSHDFVASN